MGKSSNLVDSPLPNAALSGQGFALHGVEQWGMNVLIHSLIEAQDLQKTMIVSSRYWICTLHSIRIYQDLGCVSFKNVQKQEDSNFPNKSRSFRDISVQPMTSELEWEPLVSYWIYSSWGTRFFSVGIGCDHLAMTLEILGRPFHMKMVTIPNMRNCLNMGYPLKPLVDHHCLHWNRNCGSFWWYTPMFRHAQISDCWWYVSLNSHLNHHEYPTNLTIAHHGTPTVL